jgi:hypothetical protein
MLAQKGNRNLGAEPNTTYNMIVAIVCITNLLVTTRDKHSAGCSITP